MFHYHWAVSCMIRKVSAEDIAIRGNGTGPEYMCPTRHFVYIFFNPVFQVSTAKYEINLFNNHVLIVAPVTFAPAGAMTPSAEFLLFLQHSICKTKAEIKLTSKRDTCINLASEEKRLQNDQPYVLADILGRVFLGSELGRNQY